MHKPGMILFVSNVAMTIRLAARAFLTTFCVFQLYTQSRSRLVHEVEVCHTVKTSQSASFPVAPLRTACRDMQPGPGQRIIGVRSRTASSLSMAVTRAILFRSPRATGGDVPWLVPGWGAGGCWEEWAHVSSPTRAGATAPGANRSGGWMAGVSLVSHRPAVCGACQRSRVETTRYVGCRSWCGRCGAGREAPE